MVYIICNHQNNLLTAREQTMTTLKPRNSGKLQVSVIRMAVFKEVTKRAWPTCSQEHASSLRINGTYLAPEFAEYIEYCDIQGVLVTVTLRAPVANTVI